MVLGACSTSDSEDHGVLLGSTPVNEASERMGKGSGIYVGMVGCFSNGGKIIVVQDGEVRGRATEDHLDSLQKLDPDGGEIEFYCDGASLR